MSWLINYSVFPIRMKLSDILLIYRRSKRHRTFQFNIFIYFYYHKLPVECDGVQITVASRSKAWTVFARSNAGIVSSNPTRGMDVCVCAYSVFLFSCV
jgi:hypothetical protein